MLAILLAAILTFAAPTIPPEDVQYGVCPDGRFLVRGLYDLNFPSNDYELETVGESLDNPAYAFFFERGEFKRVEVYGTGEVFKGREEFKGFAAKYPSPCDVPQPLEVPQSSM